jgi:hypothetical protein
VDNWKPLLDGGCDEVVCVGAGLVAALASSVSGRKRVPSSNSAKMILDDHLEGSVAAFTFFLGFLFRII